MTGIAKIDSPAGWGANFDDGHPSVELWVNPSNGLFARIREAMCARNAHPARTLILLPYAQLLPLAARLWTRCFPDGFSPGLKQPSIGPPRWATSFLDQRTLRLMSRRTRSQQARCCVEQDLVRNGTNWLLCWFRRRTSWRPWRRLAFRKHARIGLTRREGPP